MPLVTIKGVIGDELENRLYLLRVRVPKNIDPGTCQLYEEIRDSPKEFCIIDKTSKNRLHGHGVFLERSEDKIKLKMVIHLQYFTDFYR